MAEISSAKRSEKHQLEASMAGYPKAAAQKMAKAK